MGRAVHVELFHVQINFDVVIEGCYHHGRKIVDKLGLRSSAAGANDDRGRVDHIDGVGAGIHIGGSFL